MSIYRRKSGRYAVLIDLEATATGGRRRKSLGTYRTRKDAEVAERDALKQRDDGYCFDARNESLGDLVGRFLNATEMELAPNTWHRYGELWSVHVASTLRAIAVRKLRASHFADLYAQLRRTTNRRGGTLSGRSVYHVHRFLHRVFSWAEKRGDLQHNPLRRVEAPKPNESPARELTPNEAARILIQTEGSRWYPLLVLALATGARRGELCALQWSAVDLDQRTLTIRASLGTDRRGGYFTKSTKTGKARIIKLAQSAADVLRAVRVRQDKEMRALGDAYRNLGFVFADEFGNAPTLDGPTKAFAAGARELGIEGVTLHSCRHAVATWAIASGCDARSVASLMGHSKPSTTLNVYSHAFAAAEQGAIEAVSATLDDARLASRLARTDWSENRFCRRTATEWQPRPV